MAWDKRGYYRHGVKVNGKVGHEYYGRGPVAELAARALELLRAEREGRWAALRAARRELAEDAADLVELDALAGLMVKAALTDAGYHQHDQGIWRRRANG